MFPLDEEFYIGDFENGRSSGSGDCYKLKEGTRYSGQWKAGAYHGRGKIVYADGSFYDGFWK